METETLTLEAETSRLLELVIHSLYTHREIFLRELVSNGSDALDRLHFDGLSNPELLEDGAPLGIWLEVDQAARTLTVRDNGIGMARDEVVSHIGTIARSGTQEFQARLKSEQGRDQAIDLIGRFGVGFYSCFMAADRVTLVTRRAGQEHGTRWESSGSVNYTLTDAGPVPRGTAVTLHLKPVDTEGGIEDYTDRWVLSRIVKRYADFVTYPIAYVGPASEPALEQPDQPPPQEPAASPAPIVLNSMKPIWTRPASEVKAEEYTEFYKHIAHDWSEPLLRMAFKAEGRWEYSALLFVPAHAPYDLYYHAAPFGLQLYSQRMMIVENSQDLLPRYLRFLKGVVDAVDLPLNVSRESLQHAHHLANIRKWIARKSIDTLDKLRQSDPDKYLSVWREFGRTLKEGVSEDHDNKDRLLPLLLFESSADESKLTSLADYVSRMKPEQTDIIYMAGESRTVVERSPHLEELEARGYEVLYMTEPVDELLVQALPEFDGKRLRSAAKGAVAFGDQAERERAEQETKAQTERLGDLLTFLGKHLESNIRAAKVSRRLTASPACLTGEEFDYSPHIERLLKGKGPKQRRTLELNPNHPLVARLHERYRRDPADPLVAAGADLLFGGALLAEGTELPDPAAFTSRLTDVLAQALGAPAPDTRSDTDARSGDASADNAPADAPTDTADGIAPAD